MRSDTVGTSRIKSTFSRFIASVLAAVLSVAGLVALGPAAYADTPGITQTVTHNGQELTDGAVLESGDTVSFAIQHTPEVGDGAVVTITLPEGVTVPESELEVPTGSTTIESVTQNEEGEVVITFKDPYPPNISQEIFRFDMTLDEVEASTSTEFSWMINGTPYTREVIVTEPGAEQENVSDHLGKSVDTENLDQFVSVDQGVVSIDSDILDHRIDYTLNINTDRDTDRSDITITDDLSPYLMYDRGSFEAILTTWDDIGWNSTTDENFDFSPEFTDNGFVYSEGLESPSELTVTYSAFVDPEQLETLTSELQEVYNNLEGLGNFGLDLTNTVKIGSDRSEDATVTIGGERTQEDQPTVIEDHLAKSVTDTNLDQYISFDPTNGQVQVDEAITGHAIEYTLTVDTAADTDRSNYTITDELGDYLVYNEGSFSAEITRWGEGGWTSETEDFPFNPNVSGNSFTYTGDIPSSSELVITYTVSFDENQLGALQEALQSEFDDLEFSSGDYRVTLENTASFDNDGERDANISIGNHRGDGQGPENVSNYLNKSTDNRVLDGYVTVFNDEVSVDESILEADINYTLTIHTDGETDRSNYIIADELNDYLAYNEDSFEAEITTWNDEGWDRQTTSIDDFDQQDDFDLQVTGNGFTFTGDIENPSELTITYTASVADIDGLTDALQQAFNQLDSPYDEFSVTLENEVTFGGDEPQIVEVTVPGRLDPPEPVDLDAAFDKDANISSVNIGLDDEGALEPPQPVTYTFSADLSQWTGQAPEGYTNHGDYTLDRNVVISDTLPEQASWDTSAEDFISGMELTEAEGFDGDAAEFADDNYVNHYAVIGQDLYINIGQDNTTNVEVSAKALINNVTGIDGGDGDIKRYVLSNDAEFIFSDDKDPHGSSVEITLNDHGDGVEDEDQFFKTADVENDPVYAEAGESATVEYRFEANSDPTAAVDVTKSYIVDHRDPKIFDFSDLDQAVESIEGSLGGDAVQFDESHFDLSVNDDGDLIIQLNQNGIDLVDGSSAEPTDHYVVEVALNTVELQEQQFLRIENSATLYGTDDHPLYWSTTTSQATSSAGGAQVYKTIRDTENQRWTQNLRAEVDEDGNLLQEYYVYNLEFFPYGNYENVWIIPEHDVLPEEVEFIEFVSHDDVDRHADPDYNPPVDPDYSPVDIGGNVEAVYDDETRTVTLQSTGLLEQQDNISANVLVRVVDFEENVPVVNIFGNSPATFTPSDGYPLSIAKIDSEDDEEIINDPDSRFNVLDEDDNIVIEDAFVDNGSLRVLDDEGGTSALVVEEPGTYYVEEVVAPEGYELSTDRIRVTVNEDGTSDQVTFYNDPAPTYAIGDYVWIDSNRDGIQNDGEDPLEDVTVILEDVYGNELARTETDDAGRYIFDELLADEYRVRFILTDEQAAIYEFTDYRVPDADVEEDSNAGSSGYTQRIPLGSDNPNLVSGEDYPHGDVSASEGIDPTWDAGVVEIPDPAVEIIKGDGDAEAGSIDNDANTEEDAVSYEEDETRDVVIHVTNTGNEDLVNVVLTDETVSGTAIESLVWTTPDGTEIAAEADEDDVLTATWDGPWAVGETITGTATLTLPVSEDLHTNIASVTAEGAISGESVEDDDPYNGTPPPPVPGIDVVKNDEGDDLHQVEAGEHDVTVTITNEGNEPLENFVFEDTTEEGQDAVWNEDDLADLEELVLEVGDSFTVNGTVQVAAGETHRNNFVINADGVISGEPVDDEDPTTYVADPTYAIGDYVWIDENGNGIQDEEDTPLEDVTVVLYDGEGEKLDSTTTGADGRYIFDNLPTGEYQVGFELNEEQARQYFFTTYTEGDDAAEDSDAGENNRSAVFTLGDDSPLVDDENYDYNTVEASEGIDPTWDAGVVEFLPTVEIIKGDGDAEEGTIENDANTEDDAVAYDYDETREIVIQVTNTGNEDLVNVVLTDETQSGADIENLEWTLPNGETIEATANDDGVLTATWDGPWAVGETITGTATLTLPVSEDLHTNIASVTAEGATSGESVEDDDPYNGTPPPPPEIGVDKNEPGDDVHQVEAGAHDVTVTITNNGEEALENFEFTDTTEEGQDVVWNEDDLAGLEDLVLEVGDHFTVNGTVQVAAGETHRDNVVVNADGVISGEEVDDEDPTTYEADPTYAIGDYVWIDENGNGIQDEGETPLEDVTVVLYDGEGNELDRTVTDEHGRYLFDELPAGDYEVGFELTEEQAELYEFTGLTQGDDPAQDSNAGERGRTGVFTLGPDSPLVSDEDYEYASVSASEGIDPTWDAGVVLIPEDAETPPPADPTDPADPADPTDPADPAGPGSDTPEGDDEGPGGTLSMTGAHLALLLTAAGLILLVIGGLLYARHRKGINA